MLRDRSIQLPVAQRPDFTNRDSLHPFLSQVGQSGRVWWAAIAAIQSSFRGCDTLFPAAEAP